MIPFRHIGLAYALLAIIVFLSKRPLRVADKIAALLILSLSMPLLLGILDFGILHMRLPGSLHNFQGWPLLYGPLLYLFARSEISEKPALKKIDLLHAVPFVLAAVLALAAPSQPHEHHGPPPGHDAFEDGRGPGMEMPPPPPERETGKLPRGDRPPGPPPDHGPPPAEPEAQTGVMNAVLGIAAVVSLLAYTVLLFMLVARHRRNMSEYFSNYSGRFNLQWLRWLTLCFVITYSFALLSTQLAPDIYRSPFLHPGSIQDIAITFLIFIFSFFGIKQPVIYSGNSAEPDESANGGTDRKYEKSGLKEHQAKEYLEKINNLMKREKPYLDSSITIADVSEKLGIPRHHLTQVLNETLGKNFFMYINEYRVGEAKRRMMDTKFSDHTVLRIALDSGFNSKSGFNAIFKKITGDTPTRFRTEYGPGKGNDSPLTP